MYQSEDQDGLRVCPFLLFLSSLCCLSSFSPPSHPVEEMMARVDLEASVVIVDERLLLIYWDDISTPSFPLWSVQKEPLGRRFSPLPFLLFICTDSCFSQLCRKEQHAVCLPG